MNKSVRKVVSFLIAILTLSIVLPSFAALSYQWNWEVAFRYCLKFLDGWFTTLKISSVSFISPLSLVLSQLYAADRDFYRSSISHRICKLIRGTPLLVQIFLFYYVIADAANATAMWLAWQ